MLRFALIMTMCFMYMIHTYYPTSFTGVLFPIVSIVVYLFVVSTMDKKVRVFTITLFTTGIIIHFINGNRGMTLFDGITQNLPLLAILILAPLISIPLKREGIIDTVVMDLNRNQNDERKAFYSLSSFMFLLSPILNMGAIRIVHSFVESIGMRPKMLSRAYYMGFTPAVLWSPFYASVGIVLYTLDMTYMSYIVVGISFALIQLLTAGLLLRPKAIIRKFDSLEMGQVGKSTKKDILLLLVFVLFLLVLLISMEAILKKPMLLLVSFICLLVPLCWIIIRNKWSAVKEEYQLYKSNLLKGSRMEITLFLSAGLFGNAIANTPLVSIIGAVLEWSFQQSIAIVFLFILLFVTSMAMIGVHQIISIPLVLTTLIESGVAYNPLPIAFMCVFTWMLSAAISPLNAMNIIISQTVRENGLTVAYKWNGIYFLVITCIAFIYIYIVNIF